MDRRAFFRAGVGGAAALSLGASAAHAAEETADRLAEELANAAFRQSVCRWCFNSLSVDQLAAAAAKMGLQSVELLEPSEWATAKAHGLTCAMGYAPAGDPKTRLTVGWNREANHEWLLPGYTEGLKLAAAAGVPNVICFSGNRVGQSDEDGLAACAKGLRALMPEAERLGVTVCMELLNSKVDHHDYQCDHTPWGAALVEKVGSPRFKLLYDIYHMQIMEGDVIRTIRDHKDHIAHFHIAGVPGRHEPDASQELNYPAVMRAIADLGFTGFAAQEFLPTREPLASLADAVSLCKV
jgi:hydroxypyruvate isomerase